jgi:tetratricopeptide (TPR) repeat protein
MRTLALVAAISSALGTASPSAAQATEDTSAARELFESGLEAARHERWDEAREDFERSLAIVERPSTLLNLAGAQSQTGRLTASAASYRRYLEIAGDGASHREQAETALRALEGRLARVTVEITGGEASDELRIDDRVIAPSALDAGIELDPGYHRAVVIRDGEPAAAQRFEVREGERRTLEIALAARGVIPEGGALAGGDPVERGPSSPDDSVWIWVGVGIGIAVLAGVGIGVGVAITSESPPLYTGNLGDGMVRF